MGKTTFVASNNGLLLDYGNRRERNPIFSCKHFSTWIQLLYTATFCGIVQKTMRESIVDVLYVDRSPLSDLWYHMILNGMPLDEEKMLFKLLQQFDVFSMFPTIFVIPQPCHVPSITAQMRKRDNKIDLLNDDYVKCQIIVFEKISAFFQNNNNLRVYRVPSNIEMYTQQYFQWLTDVLKN